MNVLNDQIFRVVTLKILSANNSYIASFIGQNFYTTYFIMNDLYMIQYIDLSMSKGKHPLTVNGLFNKDSGNGKVLDVLHQNHFLLIP